MGYDFSDFQTYRNKFQKMSDEFDTWLYGFLIGEGLRFIAAVKPKTPVDTGDLRKHWNLAPNPITRQGDVIKVWFINPMEYATFVEYGHAKPYKAGAAEGSSDWVSGYFMMTVSIDQIEGSMPAKFNKSFETYLKNMGVN